MKILVTGFEPFNGEKMNPSLEAVKKLENEICGATIKKIVLPVVFRKSTDKLVEAIKTEQPDAVICVGQAGGYSGIAIERVAINLLDTQLKDNEGNLFEDEPMFADGENAYFTNLPIKKMILKIKENKLPAFLSNSAGTYVCNSTMYGLLYYIHKQFPNIQGGFIHVPYLPEQVVEKPGKSSMSLEDIVKGLTCAIQAVAEVKR